MPARGRRRTWLSRNDDSEDGLDDLESVILGSRERTASSYIDYWVQEGQDARDRQEDTKPEENHPPSRHPPPNDPILSRRHTESDRQPRRERAASSQTLREATPPPSSAGQGRTLRKRTLQQTYPFKFEKYQHNLGRSIGKAVRIETIEEAVQHEIGDTPSQPVGKKRRRSVTASGKVSTSTSKRSEIRRSVSFDNCGGLAKSVESSGCDAARTTLRVWLDGFPSASIPTTLEECNNVDKLIDFIVSSWGWRFNGRAFHYAIASFPWLSADSNILIRPGMKDSFRKMVCEIENSRLWAERGDKAICEVKITVFLQNPLGE